MEAAVLPAASHLLCDLYKFHLSQQVISELSGKNVNEVITTGECANVAFVF